MATTQDIDKPTPENTWIREMYSAFFSVHLALSLALCFPSLFLSLKIYDFYFDKTEIKQKNWSFLPKIREVGQKKIISLYDIKHFYFTQKLKAYFVTFLVVLSMPDDIMQY